MHTVQRIGVHFKDGNDRVIKNFSFRAKTISAISMRIFVSCVRRHACASQMLKRKKKMAAALRGGCKIETTTKMLLS